MWVCEGEIEIDRERREWDWVSLCRWGCRRERVSVLVCVCVMEREKEWECVYVYVYGCDCVHKCVCLCVKEREEHFWTAAKFARKWVKCWVGRNIFRFLRVNGFFLPQSWAWKGKEVFEETTECEAETNQRRLLKNRSKTNWNRLKTISRDKKTGYER